MTRKCEQRESIRANAWSVIRKMQTVMPAAHSHWTEAEHTQKKGDCKYVEFLSVFLSFCFLFLVVVRSWFSVTALVTAAQPDVPSKLQPCTCKWLHLTLRFLLLSFLYRLVLSSLPRFFSVVFFFFSFFFFRLLHSQKCVDALECVCTTCKRLWMAIIPAVHWRESTKCRRTLS